MALLPNAETFKQLVDGSAAGPGPAAVRLLLAAASLPYAAAVAARNAAFDAGLLRIGAAGVPVISVGNLTLGGTGKTPLVAWVARLLLDRGLKPAIVSRGYAARRGEQSDEAAELGVVLPGVPHVANRDRLAGARAAAAAGADAIVLDDGFQHRRLHRDLDIVAIDATDPFGCSRLFPRGMLREPLGGLARAQAVVLTRATAITTARRAEIREVFAAACRGRLPPAWMEAEHRPVALRSTDGSTRPLELLRAVRVLAFSGIGNPAAFRSTLQSLGADVVEFVGFPDHHAYDDRDRQRLGDRAATTGAAFAVTTLKDLVKLRRQDLGGVPLVAVEIAMRALAGGDEVATVVAAAAQATSSRRPVR
ncbi:MAG: tetraacyldisaccharide 4'-kinase [Planctomycetia bacterium]|nr:tetraacyldisaccharide 4'-kinase [Planctomycetia bacterium]